jgi:hypothetical protein
MNIKFCTNSISTKTKLPTLSDIVKAAQTKVAMSTQGTVTKVASTDAPSASVKKAKKAFCPNCKQSTTSCKCKGNKKCPCASAKSATTKVAEDDKGTKDEGKDSGQPKAEAKLVNQPKLPEGDKKAKSSSGTAQSEEAESSGQLDVEPLHQKGESTQEKPGSLDTQKSEKKESSKSVSFVKVANLTGKQKEFLRKTWSLYYPPSFIDALLAHR